MYVWGLRYSLIGSCVFQGDAIWVARSRSTPQAEVFVLDFVVERKRVDDLYASIKSGRYDQQKYALRRSGVQWPMYLVEGDPDGLPAGDKNVKSAAVATEIFDGFQVRCLGLLALLL